MRENDAVDEGEKYPEERGYEDSGVKIAEIISNKSTKA